VFCYGDKINYGALNYDGSFEKIKEDLFRGQGARSSKRRGDGILTA